MSALIDAKAAAEKLGYRTLSGLYHSVQRNGIPHVRIGGSIRFDPVSLDQYIELLKRREQRCQTCGQSVRRLRRVG